MWAKVNFDYFHSQILDLVLPNTDFENRFFLILFDFGALLIKYTVFRATLTVNT